MLDVRHRELRRFGSRLWATSPRPPSPPPTLGHVRALDGLRGLAVVAVFGYHAGLRGFANGYLGVDLFFVLSGFLITTLLLEEQTRTGTIALGRFFARRVRRLLPALLALLAFVAALAVFAPAGRLGQLRWSGLASLLYLGNVRQIGAGQSYFEQYVFRDPLSHTWSLAVEEHFYLLWPLALVAWLGWRRREDLGLLVGIAALAVISAVWMALLFDELDPSRAYYGTGSRVHEPLIGCLAAVWRRRPGAVALIRSPRFTLFVLAPSALVLARAWWALGSESATYYQGGSVLVSLAVAAAILRLSATPLATTSQLLGRGPLVTLGLLSYGIYLWHWPVILLLDADTLGLPPPLVVVVQALVTLLLAGASWWLIEIRIRRADLQPRRVAAAGVLATLIVAIALLVTTTGARLDPLSGANPIEAPTVPVAALPVGVPRVAVMGDSVAQSLLPGIEARFDAAGLIVLDGAFPGCSFAAGYPVDANGDRAVAPIERCLRLAPGAREQLVATYQPDALVIASVFEGADRRLEDGTILNAGSAAHRATLIADLERTIESQGRYSDRIVVVLPVARAGADPATERARIDYLADVYRQLASADSRVVVIDPASLICGDTSPCPRQVDGAVLRPDGLHYSERAAAIVADLVLAEGFATFDLPL